MPIIMKTPVDLREDALRRASDSKLLDVNEKAEDALSMLGSTSTAVAKRNIVSGEFVLAAGNAYVAIRNISRDEKLVEGVNVIVTDISQIINTLQQSKED